MSVSKKKLFAMLAAVLVMGLLLLLLTLDCSSCGCGGDEHDHEEEIPAVSDEADESHVLIDRSADDLESIELVNAEGIYHIARGENGELEIAELRGLPIETEFVEMAWFSAVSLNYSQRFTPGGELSTLESFGLEKPQAVVTCTYKDGSSTRVNIGNLMTDTEGSYYFQYGDDGFIYTGDLHFSFFQGSRYWLSDDFFNSDHNTDIEISDISLSGSALAKPCRVYANPHTEKWQRWYGYDYLINEDSTEYPGDDYACGLLHDELVSMMADEAVCAAPTADDLARYGLDAPSMVISHKRDGAEHVIRLRKSDYQTMYALVDDINVVYELNTDSYPVISSMDMSVLRSNNALVLYFETVKSFEIADGENVYRFELSREAASGTAPDLYSYSLTSSCGDVSLSAYKALLEDFNSAQAIGYDTAGEFAGQDEAALTVRVSFFDERRPDETIRCYPAGTRRYRYEINGKGDALVTQMWLDKLRTDAAALSAN